MKVVLIVKEIKVKGYHRKNGVWVGPHIRTIKVKPQEINIKLSKIKYENPNQLEFPFEGDV